MGDVFSYGVVLLELVTGKKPVADSYDDDDRDGDHPEKDHKDLVSWVRARMQEKARTTTTKSSLLAMLDARCAAAAANGDPFTPDHMLEALRIGYLCTAESPAKRPTMQQVVGLLKDMAPNLSSP
jgi:serine/threonine protein kinase